MRMQKKRRQVHNILQEAAWREPELLRQSLRRLAQDPQMPEEIRPHLQWIKVNILDLHPDTDL